MSIIYSKEQDGTLNVAVFGKVTREPEYKESAKGNRVKFSVAYGKKKYMDCEAWSDSDAGAIAGCLEKGDVVMVAGTHRTWDYNGKTYSQLTADYISPMYAPPFGGLPMQPDEQDEASAGSYPEVSDNTDDGLPF